VYDNQVDDVADLRPTHPYDAPEDAFPLPALQHPTVSFLINERATILAELTDGLGSPLHFVLPRIFEENVSRMTREFADLGIDARILFAKKANKADCLVRSAARLGIGIDVASAPELAKALAGGVTGENIGVSGPEKDERLLALALHHDSLVAIDSVQELRRLTELAERTGRVARVLLRCRMGADQHSRFGLAADERAAAVSLCVENSRHVRLHGFAFHLDGYSTEERAHAANQMIDHCLEAQSRGLPFCRTVNIGGGLSVRYVDPLDWKRFVGQDRVEHYHRRKTFGGRYPYGAERPTVQAVRDIMTQLVNTGETLLARARRNRIEFITEPGRALLDQAGFTVFRVQQVKDRRRGEGYAILTVEGSSFSLSEQWFNSEYLPDPLLVTADPPRAAQPTDDRGFLASVAGSTCLESDMLTWRKIRFPRVVEPGDRLVYLNTAGYQMDSNESPFHDVALPLKVVLDVEDQSVRWRLDSV
jgi:diaminopimelate decarboxylase